MGRPTKSTMNPLFVQDQPWEQRIDNGYPNIVYQPNDDDTPTYQLWYGNLRSLEIDHFLTITKQQRQVRKPSQRRVGRSNFLTITQSQSQNNNKQQIKRSIRFAVRQLLRRFALGKAGVGYFRFRARWISQSCTLGSS